jgi:peptide/nickel transport system substrate-binding protein
MGISIRILFLVAVAMSGAEAQSAMELRFCLRSDPKTFDPLLAAEEASETIRYLTGGVLIRFNRRTQELEPELAAGWKVRDAGKRIDFTLRAGVRFSDGAPFGPADVIATFQRVADPRLASAVSDTFRSGAGEIRATQNGPDGLSIAFAKPVAGLELLFDQLAITPGRRVSPESAVLGPFMLVEHKGGQYVRLRRNPHYWKKDAAGKQLPYADSIRLDIQANREVELLRFRRGELHVLDKLDPDTFERVRKEAPSSVLNAGPSLDSEMLWFNQNPNAPLSLAKKRWFESALFRRAISAAINRDDIIRLVYRGYARPAVGPVSPANKVWFNRQLRPPHQDANLAMRLLQQDGFRFDGRTLRDREGNTVEFSLITNAGSKTRAQIGAMLQQDLKKIGIRLNFTPIEFQSLIERITRTQQYETCLLGLANVEVDPASQTNVWLSSGTHHAWNPGQAKPATDWEAEIDRLMKAQATAVQAQARKTAFDRVQDIISEQAPILYLVYPDVLLAISPSVRHAAPSALPPHLLWNVERLSLVNSGRSKE